jgi:hypothetical protein
MMSCYKWMMMVMVIITIPVTMITLTDSFGSGCLDFYFGTEYREALLEDEGDWACLICHKRPLLELGQRQKWGLPRYPHDGAMEREVLRCGEEEEDGDDDDGGGNDDDDSPRLSDTGRSVSEFYYDRQWDVESGAEQQRRRLTNLQGALDYAIQEGQGVRMRDSRRGGMLVLGVMTMCDKHDDSDED